MVTVKKENVVKAILVSLFFPVLYFLIMSLFDEGYILTWKALNIGATPDQVNDQLTSVSLLLVVVTVIVFFMITFIIFKAQKKDLLKRIQWNPAPRKSVYALVVLLALGLFLTAFLLVVVIPQSWLADDVAGNAITNMSPILVILIMGIIAPIAEETVFRGLMMTRLQQRVAPWLAVTLTTLVFAVFHIGNSVGHVLTVLPFALSVCLVFLWTKSIRVTMFLHALYNTILVSVSVLATNLSDSSTTSDASNAHLAPAIMGLIGLAIVVLALAFIYKHRQKAVPDSSVMPSN
ncbi:MAG: CPBP family intramembrane metalloprotease [Nitrososphaerota archaeon]|jgi:membrane protease YdiL (CAAX protease family)|nr:CPBP family intramembrane metalloprotease [Nitrososphaerota archaeon]